MFIEPITCSSCGRVGRPGEIGFSCRTEGITCIIDCGCGAKIHVSDAHDQLILSKNELCRLGALSNHHEWGEVSMAPGESRDVKFSRPIDSVCRTYFVPDAPVHLKEDWIKNDGMIILCSMIPDKRLEKSVVTVTWSVYGLVDTDKLSSWYVLFYGAVTSAVNGLHKAALLDYAASFEAFLAEYLRKRMTSRYGEGLTTFLLRRSQRVEDRCKDLLKLITQYKLSDRQDVYGPWDKFVRKPMDKVRHGEPLMVGKEDSEAAHQVVYQAIRWIDNIAEG